MARLGQPAALPVTGECLEVREGERDGEVVCTLSRAVEVYNLFDHRCVHSWPLSSTDCVTCHAHYHSAMRRYCAVRNRNELLLWTSEDKSLPPSPPTLPSSPLSLLSPSLPHHLITVDAVGTISMVTVRGGEVSVLSEVVIGGRQTRSKKLRILTSRVCCVGGRECVVVMCRGGDVYVCAVSEKEISISATLVLGSKLLQQSMVAMIGERLVVAGSDGAVVTFDLCHTSPSPRSLLTTPPSSATCITGVSSNYFAIADKVGVVSLRDTVYGTSQASMNTGLHNISLVRCVCGHLVVCGGEGVRVLTVSGVSEASLASVLGRKTTPSLEATLVLPQWAEPAQSCADWESKVTTRGSEEEVKIQQLSDPRKTPTLEGVVSVFPSPLTLHPLAYGQLVRRLTVERQFWAHTQLVQLVQYGAVSGSATGELVVRAVEQRDWSLVSLVLKGCQHLPEGTLVSLLHHALELPEEVESYGELIRREDVLWATLSLPYSDSLLQLPLSHLPLSAVLSLLQFLTPHVSVVSLSCQPPVPYPHLLDWLSVLLDTHWTALTLSPHARDILKNYRHTTYHQMLFCENMATVQNMLESAQNPSPRQPLDQKYSVERLKLKI